MLNLNFTTEKFHWVETPPDVDGYTFKVLTLDKEGNVVVFARTTSKEAAQAICKEYNGERDHRTCCKHRVFG